MNAQRIRIARRLINYLLYLDFPLVRIGIVTDQETGSAGGIIKISVLASGTGYCSTKREVSISELEVALQAAKLHGATVQYTRENPYSEAPPEAEQVIKLVAAHRLRISLTTEPDGRPSNVLEFPTIETFFAKVRRKAAANRGVSLVRPDQKHFILPAPKEGSINPQMIAGVQSVVPSDQPRNIAAIAPADALAGDPSVPPTLPDIGRRVPFFGLLIGLGYVGHAVWIFEPLPSMMTAGCEEADVLIVDSNAIATLPPNWLEDAGVVMRNPNILRSYDRTRQKVGAIRTAGEVPGQIEFPN